MLANAMPWLNEDRLMQCRREDDLPPGALRGVWFLARELWYAVRLVISFFLFNKHTKKVVLCIAFYCYLRDVKGLKHHTNKELNIALELALYEESFNFPMEFYHHILKQRVVWQHLLDTGTLAEDRHFNEARVRELCVRLSQDIPLWLTYATPFEMANDLTNVYFKVKNFEQFGTPIPYLSSS